MESLEMGTPSQFADDSVVCRYYHAGAAVALPSYHCDHLARSGLNNVCAPRKYKDWIDPLFHTEPRLFA